MSRDNNSIAKMRLEAWEHLSRKDLWSCIYLGEDYLALDELACKMYRALVSMDKEDLAVARHAFSEFYDLKPGQLPSDPYERPPEITQQLKDRGLIP